MGGPVDSTDDGDARSTNLADGIYYVTVTDTSGCSVDTFVEISLEPMTANFTVTDAPCAMEMQSGSIVTGAVGPLPSAFPPFTLTVTYDWDYLDVAGNEDFGGGDPTDDPTNIFWTDRRSYTGSQSPPWSICLAHHRRRVHSIPFSQSMNLIHWFALGTVDSADCNGAATGAIDLTATGGTPFAPPPDYTYSWSGGLGTVEDPTNVAAGTYTVTVTDDNGCTSTLSVTIEEPDSLELSASFVPLMCYGDTTTIDLSVVGGIPPYTYNWDGVGTSQDTSGVGAGSYSVTVTDANGCTEDLPVSIMEGALETLAVNESHCAGDSVQVYGEWYTSTGSPYMDTIASTTGGCDTVVTITITEDALPTNAVSLSHCPDDSVSYYGVFYTAPGSPYIDTIASTTGGCDTIVTITVTEDPLIPLAVSASHCAGDSVQVYGEWYTSTGSPYTDTVASTTGGCDTVVTITITEDALPTNAVSLSHCPDDSVSYYGVFYTAPGSPYIDTIASTTGGCDTIVTITVTEDPLIPLAVSASHCAGDSVQVYGEWYTSTGSPYTDTVASTTGGCDTVVTITITEDALPTNAVSLSHCPGDSVSYYGVFYTAPGSPYIDTIASTTGGCDTIVTITVTEDPLIPLAVSASHCAGDSVQVYGEWYTSVGSPYTDTVLSTTGGCDTLVTITITEDPLPTNAVSLSHCPGDSVSYYGVFYTAPGSPYIDTIASTTGGCDTIVTITVTEDPLIPLAVSASHCAGDSVQVYGEWYTSVGSPYTDTVLSTTGGCDTLVTITITEDPLETNTVSLSHCPGDSVSYYGVFYTAPGSPYIDTIASTTGGCDTIVTITVTEDPLIPLSVSASHCAGDSVQVYGDWYTSVGSPYTDTVLSTTGGCDTLVTITITEDPLETNAVSLSHCPGDSVSYYGVFYTAPGSPYIDTIASTTGGCDTIVTITVTEDPLIPLAVSASHCAGDSVQVYGEWYTSVGSPYIDTITSTTGGCDTVVTITVTEESLIPLSVSASYCAGDSVQVYGEWYTAAGSPYTDTVLSTTGGCDTLVTITITEDPLVTDAVSLSHCPGDSVSYYGVFYTAPGSPYIDTIASTTGGCDTIVTITVTEDPLIPLAVSASHCAGDSVQVYGEWYTSTGSPYTDTVASTTGGCDTLVTITITEDPLETNAVSLSHCPGDSVSYYGVFYTAPGSPYIDTIASTTGGCDTIVTITVTEDPLIPLAVSASHCAGDSVQVYGEWYTSVGSPYIDTIASTTGGCDTVVTITVTEESLIPLAVSASHCAGDSVQVYGEWYTSAGSPFTDTVVSTTGGCDTLVTITISEDPLVTDAVSLSHCPGDSVSYYGVFYTAPGSPYIDTIGSTTGGCDTIVTITVTEDPLIPFAVSASHCAGDSVQVYGEWYTSVGSPYTDTVLSTTGGCDTLVTITITEDPLETNAVSLSHCPGDSVSYYGVFYTAPGSPYIDTIASTTGGCDTVVTITVTEDPLVPLSVSASHCAGDSVQVYGEWYTSSGSPYTDTVLSTTGGCDTLVTITITEDPLETNAVSLSHCPGDSVSYYGVFYTAPGGPYIDTIASTTGGCDTIVTITVTEDPLIPLAVSASHCAGDSVQVYGEWYTSAGSPYIDTIASTTGGCDTVVTITVTEESLIPLFVSASHCAGDSVQVYGEWYTSSGSPYTDTVLSTTGGCDTLLTITITEDPLETNAVSLSHCPGDSVSYYGVFYTAPGSPYIDTIASTTGGCDTIVTITVTEDPLVPLSVSASHCAGDSVQVYGVWYTASGSPYTDTIPTTTTGCDTVVTITITEDPLETNAVSLSHCPGDSVSYYGVFYTAPGSPYVDTIASTTGGCDTIVTITVTEDPLVPLSVSASHCAGDSVQVYGVWYTASGSPYTDTIPTTTTGCDTVVTITITEDPLETNAVSLSHCPGDSVSYYGVFYTAPGSPYIDTIASTTGGCDTIVTITVTEDPLVPLSVSASHCAGDSVQVYGVWYTASGSPYTDTIPTTTTGCDTVVTITITEDPLETNAVSLSHCPGDSVSYYGVFYTAPGSPYVDTIASTTVVAIRS